MSYNASCVGWVYIAAGTLWMTECKDCYVGGRARWLLMSAWFLVTFWINCSRSIIKANFHYPRLFAVFFGVIKESRKNGLPKTNVLFKQGNLHSYKILMELIKFKRKTTHLIINKLQNIFICFLGLTDSNNFWYI